MCVCVQELSEGVGHGRLWWEQIFTWKRKWMRDTVSPACRHSWPVPINKGLVLATGGLLSLSVHTEHTCTEWESEREEGRGDKKNEREREAKRERGKAREREAHTKKLIHFAVHMKNILKMFTQWSLKLFLLKVKSIISSCPITDALSQLLGIEVSSLLRGSALGEILKQMRPQIICSSLSGLFSLKITRGLTKPVKYIYSCTSLQSRAMFPTNNVFGYLWIQVFPVQSFYPT